MKITRRQLKRLIEQNMMFKDPVDAAGAMTDIDKINQMRSQGGYTAADMFDAILSIAGIADPTRATDIALAGLLLMEGNEEDAALVLALSALFTAGGAARKADQALGGVASKAFKDMGLSGESILKLTAQKSKLMQYFDRMDAKKKALKSDEFIKKLLKKHPAKNKLIMPWALKQKQERDAAVQRFDNLIRNKDVKDAMDKF